MASADPSPNGSWLGLIDPDSRLAASAAKIAEPFQVDPTMRFYSPQDNVDAFEHPRVAEHLRWLLEDWTPAPAEHRIALLLPCTASKPYSVSPEHQLVNGALLGAGWLPSGPAGAPPSELLDALAPDADPALAHTGVMERDGVGRDRVVVSEPLALVPYDRLYHPGCPATAYDDPGLFEWRGTSVAPWRADCTATYTGDGRWAWGPIEHAAYTSAHNSLSKLIAEVLVRVLPAYDRILAWLPAGLTHRSFLGSHDSRRTERLPVDPVGPNGPLTLVGVGDLAPGLVELMDPGDGPAQVLARLDAVADSPR